MSLFLTIFEGTTPADARPVVAISDADIIAAVRRLLFERLADNVKRKGRPSATNARGVPRTCHAGSQRAGPIVARGRSAHSKAAEPTSPGFTDDGSAPCQHPCWRENPRCQRLDVTAMVEPKALGLCQGRPSYEAEGRGYPGIHQQPSPGSDQVRSRTTLV